MILKTKLTKVIKEYEEDPINHIYDYDFTDDIFYIERDGRYLYGRRKKEINGEFKFEVDLNSCEEVYLLNDEGKTIERIK